MRVRLAGALFALVLCSCAHGVEDIAVIPGLAGAAKIYTLTTLHPDPEDRRLYAANFQQLGLIPICSEVSLLRYRAQPRPFLTFRVESTGTEYEYDDHGAAGEPFAKNLARYFGPACPRAQLDALSDSERAAVAKGVVEIGMRKQAVLLALGDPPKRDTPSLEDSSWRYWRNRWTFFVVRFGDDGRVSEILGDSS
ncbi:MAG TPA: hypothetical protein VEI82_10780 [Myxococcota bacterium]|nr:hypothetical protein [Myxococcota bacterium]